MISQNLGKYSFIAIATFIGGVFIINNTVGNALEMDQSKGFQFSQSNQNNLQQSKITLSSQDLKYPQTLNITISRATQIWGTIQVNDRVIQKINTPRTQLNLSSYISKPGKHIIRISGFYHPANASVSVEYSVLNNQTSQTIGGSGKINQVLIIDVL